MRTEECQDAPVKQTHTFAFVVGAGSAPIWNPIRAYRQGEFLSEMHTGRVYMRTSAGALRIDDQSGQFLYDSALPGAFRKVKATITVEL